MKQFAIAISLLIFSSLCLSDDRTHKAFGNSKVYFSAFNSSFIKPEIADTYRITRGKDKGLVNVALVEDGKAGGKSAEVRGTVSNIFAQSQTLNFFEIREGDSVYYLAPFSFENEDFLTFKINVRQELTGAEYPITFQRTMYHEN